MKSISVLLLLASVAFAKEPQQWAQSPLKGWADQQQVMPGSARVRFNCNPPPNNCSCCSQGDIVKTHFRAVSKDVDGWEWLDLKDNIWKTVPDDIIHWDEDTPTGEGVIFIRSSTNTPACFFPPSRTAQ